MVLFSPARVLPAPQMAPGGGKQEDNCERNDHDHDHQLALPRPETLLLLRRDHHLCKECCWWGEMAAGVAGTGCIVTYTVSAAVWLS